MNPQKLRERWKDWRLQRAVEKYRQRLDIAAQKPRASIPSLRRALTIPAAKGAEQTWPSSEGQATSPLFNKFSFDIREQVYRHIIGNKCFHIVRKGRRLAFLFCQAQSPRNHGFDHCWGYEKDDGTFRRRYELRPNSVAKLSWDMNDPKILFTTDGGLLPLLLSCRDVYSECIQIIYQQNKFAIDDEATWGLFRSIVPSNRIACIRDLHLQLMYRFTMIPSVGHHQLPEPDCFREEEDWIEFWKSIEMLKGLKYLDVTLVEMPRFWKSKALRKENGTWCGAWELMTTPGEDGMEDRDMFLDPLRKIKDLDKFVLELPQVHDLKVDDPFTVVYPKSITAETRA